MENVIIIMDETPEKYRSYAELVVPDFVKLFREYTKMTAPYIKQRKELAEKWAGTPRTAENWNDFDEYDSLMDKWSAECKNKKLELLTGRITDNIYVTPHDLYPSRFDFFNNSFKLRFIMKSAKKITIDAIDESTDYVRYRFILRPDDDKWLIDWLGYSYEEEGALKKWDL